MPVRSVTLYLSIVACVLFTGVVGIAPGQAVIAQESSSAEQKQIAERFLAVLVRRPRPGTALDRVYGYHIQAGSLDEFINELRSKAAAGGDDAGAYHTLIGLLQMQRGSDAAAVAALQAAEPLVPDDAMVSYYLGKALLLVGKTDQAAAALERAVQRGPARNDALMVYKELGRIYQRAEQNEKALSVWNRLEDAFPGDTRVSEEIATTLAQEGQLDSALERYEQLALKNDAAGDYRTVGYQIAAAELKRRLGRQDEAIADLEKILSRLRPGSWLHSDVRHRIEAGFLSSGDYASLADYYAGQVEKNPDDIDTRLRHGRSLAKSGLLIDAIESLGGTVEKAPEDKDVRLALADVYVAAGKPAEAAKQFEALAKLDPENPDYLVGWGNLLLEDKSIDKPARQRAAAAVWQRLVDARSDDAVIISQVADLMRKVDNTEKAIELYRRSIELAPTQPQYREYLGEYLHRLDRKHEALEVWASLAQGNRKNRDSLIRLAEVLTLFQYPDKALAAFAEAETMDPTFAQRMRYAELLSRSERYDDSLAQLDKAAGIVETPEEREQVLRARIEVYASSGTLADRIADAEKQVADDTSNADAYRHLAMLLDAAARSVEAMGAAEKAVELAPQDTAALSVAAELYRKSSRYADAVAAYRQLAESDVRYLSNYLQRIAGLQMRLGKVDDALATGKELIAAQPGNPESYRFYSDLCFQSGRDDEGVDTLRRALRAAPRESSIRDALARVLANRFRTDEAIELYWQSLDAATELDEQKRLVASVAPLYERKGDFARLISRLEDRGRETSDARTTALLISEAQKATSDLGAARQTLEPLLAENPRDADLLTQIVSLSAAADDWEPALEYQKQLTALADTPENRRIMLTLMVDSGQIEQAEASLQLMQEADDPVTMVSMIDRMIRRNDNEAAIRLCRTALQQRGDLWEIKTRLAGLLVMDGKYDEAVKLADEVRDLKLKYDVPAASFVKPRSPPSSSSASHSTAAVNPTPRMYRTQSGYQLASFFKVGRYANSYSSSRQNSPLDATTYGQADYIAFAVKLAAAAKQGRLDELIQPMISEQVITKSSDVNELWQAYDAFQLQSYFSTNQSSYMPLADAGGIPDLRSELYWRLAELDRVDGQQLLYTQLSSRDRIRSQLRNPPENMPAAALANLKEPEPLSEGRLQMVLDMYEKQQNEDPKQQSFSLIGSSVYGELVAAGRNEEAAKIKASFATNPETIQDTGKSLQFFLVTREVDSVKRILGHIKQNFAAWASESKAGDLAALISMIGSAATEIVPELRLDAVDMMIAMEARQNSAQGVRRSRSSSQRSGTAHTYYYVGGNYQSQQVAVPFSSVLLSDSFVQSFYQQFKFGVESPERNELMAHLRKPIGLLDPRSDAAAIESKLRSTLFAYATWWTGDIDGAYEAIVNLSQEYPEDNDLWIERARLAAELHRPRESLEALDAINPLDQTTLRTREMAAMNLASKLGEFERAKLAARRLFGMRLDLRTELALSDQLSRLGMNDMARAVLQRSRRRGGQSTSNLLEIGQRYLRGGDKEAAAEVAFAAMRKLNSGNDRNDSHYRQQAASMLKQAGRLDALVQQAEQRVESAPNSLRLQTELAELYTAAGRKEDANQVLEKLTAKQPNNTVMLLATAKQFVSAGKPGKAVEHYLAAFKKDPNLIRNEYYNFERAVTDSKRFKYAYTELSKWNLSKIDSYSLSRMVNLYRRAGSKPGPEALEFIDHVLKSAPPASMSEVLRYAARSKELSESGAVASAMERVFADDSVYAPGSDFWMRYSRSSGGTANGPLEPCIISLDANPEVRDKVIKMLEKRVGNEATRAVAEPILAAVTMSIVGTDETIKTFKALIEKQDRTTPFPLWWQIGQVLEKKEETRDLGVEVLEYVQTYPQAAEAGSSYQYGIGAKLADSYVKAGQKKKARKQLLIGYEKTDNSRENQYNPGYGDYSDLRSYEAIAKKLIEVDAPLDAIRIYADALATPEKFDAAKRYSGSRDYKKQFEDGLAKATQTLKPAHYRGFFEQIIVETSNEQQAKPGEPFVNLLPTTAHLETKPEDSSVSAMVIYKLAESDDGRAFLKETQDRLRQLSQDRQDDWSLVALQAMIAVSLDDSSAETLLTQLNQLVVLPDVDNSKTRKVGTRLLALYSPALMALASEVKPSQQAAFELSAKLGSLAQKCERPQVARVLMIARIRAAGTSEGSQEMIASMHELLDATIATSDPIRVVTSSLAKDILQVAEMSMKVGADDVAAEAVRRAFGGGPPLLVVGNQSGTAGAFIGIGTSSSSSNSQNSKNDIDLLSVRIMTLADQMKDRTGGKQRVYGMLREVVMPATRAGELFPYLRPVVGRNATYPYDQNQELNLRSLSELMVQAAIDCGKADELNQMLSKRRELVKNNLLADLVAVQLSLGQGNREEALAGLDRMASSIGIDAGQLADADDKAVLAEKLPADVVTVTNLLLHATLPLAEVDPDHPTTIAVRRTLLKWSGSEREIATQDQLWRKITNDLLRNDTASAGDRGSLIDSFLSSIRQRYANYAGGYGDQKAKAERANLAKTMLEIKDWSLAGSMLRDTAIASGGIKLHDKPQDLIPVALQIADTSAQQQYDLLGKIMFGETGDLEPQDWTGYILYAVPPKELQELVPKLQAIRQLSTSHADLPILSVSLMIAEAAAQGNKTDDLIAKLTPHVKQPGDETDAMIGLARIAAGDEAAAVEVLQRVATRLQETVPKENGDEPVNVAAGLLAARCLNVQNSKPLAIDALTDLLQHVRRSKYVYTRTFFGRVLAKNGGSPAAGAKEVMPLKHFVAVQIPYASRPESPNTEPLFVFRGGSLRYAGGADQNSVLLKYPLEGDFTFSYRNVRHGWSDSSTSYGGVAYTTQSWEDSISAVGLVTRGAAKFPCKAYDKKGPTDLSLRFEGDKIHVGVNGQQVITDKRFSGMPFAAAHIKAIAICDMKQFKIEGNPTIPREVNMIDDRLRGWSMQIYYGSVPNLDLPIAPDEDAKQAAAARTSTPEQESSRRTWYADNGTLKTGKRGPYGNLAGMGHLQYLRPLCEGESITYEFRYEPDKVEVHPTLGRTAILLRSDGIKLRWLVHPKSIESADVEPLNQVEPTNWLDGKQNYALKANDWNQVKLTADVDGVKVEVNGHEICYVGTGFQQKFGVLHEQDRSCELRNLFLSGPWPKTVPNNLMEQK